MTHEAFLNNLAVWIHTCPQRAGKIGETTASLKSSDLAPCGVHICSAGVGDKPLSYHDTIDWWLERWLEMSQRGQWVLRLEDDIVVQKHIGHNLATWPALRQPDFGLGMGFTFDYLLRDLGGVEFLPNKLVRTKAKAFAAAQCQLIHSQLIPQIVQWIRDHRNDSNYCAADTLSWFDVGLTAAITELGLRTYLHIPSLVQTNELSRDSAFIGGPRIDHHANRTYLADWRRPDEYEEEFLAEVLLKDRRTRWALLGDNTIHKVTTPANLDPVAGPVTIGGRPCVLRSECLFDSSMAASDALQRRLGKAPVRRQKPAQVEIPGPMLITQPRAPSTGQKPVATTEHLPAYEGRRGPINSPRG